MARGVLTDEIQKVSKEFFGREITVRELRLLPYIDFTIKNNKVLGNISNEERAIVMEWMEKGYLTGFVSKFSVTREFYNIMQSILWLAYVEYS